jgi:hypothetical protein
MRHWLWKPTFVVWKYWVPSLEKWRRVISFKVRLYRSWTRFPLFACVWMVCQCLGYSILISGSFGNILSSMDGLLEDWGLLIRLLIAGLLDGPCSGEAGLWTSIHGLTSGISVTEHVFPSITKLTTNGTGKCVVVGFLVAFLIIRTAELFSADVAGLGLRILDVSFHVSSEIALLHKLFPTFFTHVLLKRKNRNPC